MTRQRDDAKAANKQNRAERYGSASHQMKHDSPYGKEDNDRDAEEEKKGMGGKGSVKPLPDDDDDDDDDGQDEWTAANYNQSREYRQGLKHNQLSTDETCHQDCDRDAVPDD